MKLMHRSLLLARCAAVAGAIAATSAGAAADVQSTHAIADFRTVDTDRDGKLNRAELMAAAGLDFDRLAAGRHALTRAQLGRAHSAALLLPVPARYAAAALFKIDDTDHDAKIDKREYEHTVAGAYMRCDANRDGTIEISDLRHCSL